MERLNSLNIRGEIRQQFLKRLCAKISAIGNLVYGDLKEILQQM